MEPIKRNNQSGDQAILKRFDHFLVEISLFQEHMVLKTNLETGGLSNHRLISLTITIPEKKQPSPFKFSLSWLEEEEYRALVFENWNPLGIPTMATYMQHMVEKITRIKELMKEWGQKHKVHYPK